MYEIKEYKGYTIEIHWDDCAISPFKQWDGLPSLLSVYDGYLDAHGEFDAEYLPNLTREEIKINLSSIFLLLEDCNSLWDVKNKTHGYDGWPLDNSSLVDKINTILQSQYSESSLRFRPEYYCEKFTILSEILKIKNIPHLLTSSTGYVQGDYKEILIIAEKGEEYNQHYLQSTADLYSAWCWGDAYGYKIKDKGGSEVECLWGFYGKDHEKSGLLDDARSAIDFHVSDKRKKKLEKVKTLIKNKVSLEIREKLLSNI